MKPSHTSCSYPVAGLRSHFRGSHLYTSAWLKNAVPFTLALIAFLIGTSAQGQVYKCKDNNGRVTYSGAPCEYGSSPMSISDNTVQGERRQMPELDTGAPSATQSQSPNCAQLENQIAQATLDGAPRKIVDNWRYQSNLKNMRKGYELTCLGVASTDEPKPMKATKKNRGH